MDYLKIGDIELFATTDYKIYGFAVDGNLYPTSIPSTTNQGDRIPGGKTAIYVGSFLNEAKITYGESLK